MDWLLIVQTLQRLSQTGLAYCESPFDRERYEELMRLAADIAARHSGEDAARVESILRMEGGYPTPKVDVRAVVPRDGKLLFVREMTDGRWSLPGGWADIGDSPAEVTAREVFEETGYAVRPLKLLALLDKAKHAHPRDFWYVYKVFFRCELVGGEPKLSHESLEIRFFGEDELPELSLPRNTEGQVRRMFEHLRNPDWPTDFD